jgi:O-antigen/teichoic acid export membrane protein
VGLISIIFASTLLNIFYSGVLAEQLERLVPFMIVLLSMNALMETHYASLDGLHKTVARSVISIVGNLACIVLAFLLIPKFGIVGAAFAQISQALVSILLCRIVLIRAISYLGFFPRHFSFFSFKELLKFGSSIHVGNLSGFGFDPLMKISVVHFGGPILLAYYDLSLKTIAIARSAFGAAFIPIYNNFSAFKFNDLDINYDYFENISRLNSFLVGLAFSSLVIITPLISLVFLENLDLNFIFLACSIAIGYAGNALIIPMYMYAQSKKKLFWNNCGQLTIACTSLLICFLISFYDNTLVVYAIPIGLLLGSYVSYLGNRKDFVDEYIRLKDFHLNEARFVRAILSVVLTAVIILGINFYLV